MSSPQPKKEKSFYYKIFLSVLGLTFLNIAYLLFRGMYGEVSFYFFRLDEKTIYLILCLIAMPVFYVLLFFLTLFIEKNNRNLIICCGILSLASLGYIHSQTTAANYSYKQQKKIDDMNLERFKWEESNNAPLGYPIDVYMGGLELKGGGYVGLSLGTSSGMNGWGAYGSGITSDVKPLPDRLNIIWLSYAEDTFYHIDCDIDYDKILRLFQEGFEYKYWDEKSRHETYSSIVVGYAPGGVVVVWVHSPNKQVEIGRYQGKRTVISQEEINSLDYPKKLFFQQSYRDETMNDEYIVPTAVREANKNRPIPYGLWDTYREKYLWRPTFKQNNFLDSTFTVLYARLEMFNGEIEKLFDESLDENRYANRAILRRINFAWKDKNDQVYSGTVELDNKALLKAFEGAEGQKIDLEFTVNISNSFITAKFKSGDKEIFINEGAKVEVFKSRKKYK